MWLTRPTPRTVLLQSCRPAHLASPSCFAFNEGSAAAVQATSSVDEVPPGCSRYTVRLGRPLGMVLEQSKDGQGGIVVAEVVPGGKAERTEIAAGDALISVSGTVYTRESQYNGNWVRSGEKQVTLNVRNETFDTIMAAIGSHKAGQAVEMTFQRC
eukprot:TRINITY_DN46898_c0_g1_i2.p2 TRINITY_DN46898_c0_g1~~TRINITY_DN46898_c0_g1_i2.p2  ORF type:complete len:156 (-),score=11.48 TRINITY_DN46898_c0_g1_i2:576-1043(-)